MKDSIRKKSLDVNGRKIEYEVFYDVSEYGETYETAFYEGTKIVSRKKYFLFGEPVSKGRTDPRERLNERRVEFGPRSTFTHGRPSFPSASPNASQ